MKVLFIIEFFWKVFLLNVILYLYWDDLMKKKFFNIDLLYGFYLMLYKYFKIVIKKIIEVFFY